MHQCQGHEIAPDAAWLWVRVQELIISNNSKHIKVDKNKQNKKKKKSKNYHPYLVFVCFSISTLPSFATFCQSTLHIRFTTKLHHKYQCWHSKRGQKDHVPTSGVQNFYWYESFQASDWYVFRNFIKIWIPMAFQEFPSINFVYFVYSVVGFYNYSWSTRIYLALLGVFNFYYVNEYQITLHSF